MSKAKPRIGLLVGGVAIVAGLVALLASGFGKDPTRMESQLVGQVAPDFQLVDLDGAPVSLAALRGAPVVLNFWSTWCGPCKYEHPLLLQATRENPDVRFFGVIYQDEPEKIRRYLARQGAAYPHLVDDGGRLAIDYGVTGVPETFFIDRAGHIVHKQNGQLDAATLSGWLGVLRRR